MFKIFNDRGLELNPECLVDSGVLLITLTNEQSEYYFFGWIDNDRRKIHLKRFSNFAAEEIGFEEIAAVKEICGLNYGLPFVLALRDLSLRCGVFPSFEELHLLMPVKEEDPTIFKVIQNMS